MSGFDDTWLVVPCYNEGTVIFDVLTHARKTFPNIVAVNDGSRDNSAAQIRAAGAHLVNHPVNLGQGAAIQTGVEYARSQPGARYFVTFDADGQHQVKDVLTMVGRLRSEPVDIVVGTPGRLIDLMRQKYLDLSHVKVAVLDEADEMLSVCL